MIPVRNIYYLLCYAWDSLEEAEALDVSELGEFERIQDLFGTVLARGVMRVARRGIDRSYVPFQEDISGVRGKIEIAATLKQGTLLRNRLVCSFDELSADILHNQIIASTLKVLSRHSELNSVVRQEVQLAGACMASVSILPLSQKTFSRVHLDRNRRVYRFLINVCRLLHETRLVDPESGQTRFADVDLSRMTMWRVFERFAARFYEREQTTFRVSPQSHIRWWDLRPRGLGSESRIPIMQPDLLLEGGNRRILLDTKFYRSGGLDEEPGAKLDSGNLYQLFAYVMNRERAYPDGPPHEGILLYPTVGEETRVEFMTHGHRFQARSVDLGRPWREIHERMLEVVGDA